MNMSNETIVVFDETLLRLPSCLTVHAQYHSNLNKFTSDNYVQYMKKFKSSHICGIIRKNETETIVLGLAVYRCFLNTFDTIHFEIDDLIIDEKERNHGLGKRLFYYLIEQAKQSNALKIVVHCDLINTDAHRFLFRHDLTIVTFEFYTKNDYLLEINDQIHVIDITDLPDNEKEKLIIQSHEIFRQLRPHLPTDQKAYVNQIKDICRTGPARMIVAIKKDDNEKKEILGLSIYRVTNTVKYAEHIYCDDLVTNETSRSLGVGRCLINHMKNEGKKLGFNHLILDSGCQRGRAHKFYYREGFVISRFLFNKLI